MSKATSADREGPGTGGNSVVTRRRRIADLFRLSRDGRALVVADLISTTGTGLFLVGGLVYLVRWASYSLSDVSIGFTTAGLVGVALTYPIGRAADRIGVREVAAVAFALRAVAVATLTMVRSLPALVAVMSVALTCERGGQAAFSAIVARVGGAERVRLQASLRSVTNIGVSIGTGLGGLLVASGERTSFLALLFVDAGALACGAVVLCGVTRIRPTRPAAHTRPVLRDRVYLAAAGLHSVMSLNYEVLTFALPLVIAARRDIPYWLISVCVIINTLLVVAFQAPASRNLRTSRQASGMARRAGLVFFVSCALFATVSGSLPGVAIAVLVTAVAVHSVGEVWQAAGSFLLSFELAQEHAHGRYQALFVIGEGVERALAPAVLGILCLAWGVVGWLVLGTVIATAGALFPLVVRSAERRAETMGGATG